MCGMRFVDGTRISLIMSNSVSIFTGFVLPSRDRERVQRFYGSVDPPHLDVYRGSRHGTARGKFPQWINPKLLTRVIGWTDV
jgi:hypothetical protein